MSKTTLIEQSKIHYSSEEVTHDSIQTGCLQRIAAAIEKMATNHLQLLEDLDFYRERYKINRNEIGALNRRVSSLKGVITKLKKKQTV